MPNFDIIDEKSPSGYNGPQEKEEQPGYLSLGQEVLMPPPERNADFSSPLTSALALSREDVRETLLSNPDYITENDLIRAQKVYSQTGNTVDGISEMLDQFDILSGIDKRISRSELKSYLAEQKINRIAKSFQDGIFSRTDAVEFANLFAEDSSYNTDVATTKDTINLSLAQNQIPFRVEFGDIYSNDRQLDRHVTVRTLKGEIHSSFRMGIRSKEILPPHQGFLAETDLRNRNPRTVEEKVWRAIRTASTKLEESARGKSAEMAI
ncbi:MAG: hypothetical protein K2Z81_02090, partial [Cyanobacteria bacterium]|nr:hypothetical protein [Cyanobacteriota bacterium]